MTLRGWLGLTLLPGVYAALDAERARTLELCRVNTRLQERLDAAEERGRQREQALLEQFAQERAQLLNRFVGLPPGENAGEKDTRQRVGPSRVLSPLQRQMKASYDKYQESLRIQQESAERQQPVTQIGEDEALQVAPPGEAYLRQQALEGAG